MTIEDAFTVTSTYNANNNDAVTSPGMTEEDVVEAEVIIEVV